MAELAGAIPAAPARRRIGSRTAFSAALTTFMIGTLVSFGGASYAAGGATTAFHAVKRVAATHPPKVLKRSAASAQYGTPTTPKPSTKPKPKPTPTIQGGTKGVTIAPKPKPKPVPPVVKTGQLPFTGLSLVTTSVLGFALIVLGILLRRRERQSS